ncbi:hypothetical protein GCK72_000649 [Caenorhabditis remanei]|uniref:Uncharacterized protein n=1 Tax=Caenorhabditis remanei TaxID=31234 RepID=A0A6A5HQ88_CAERE|nr:hypothetical protein GCK72_000649 [Caenorhabditis remanei]KAF1768836.1 hypothetical protein GCK72_000649 [Caenorhabditis remanei]
MEMEDYGGGEFVYESDEWEDGEIDLRDDDEIDRKKEKELRMRNRKTIIYLKYVDKHLKGMKKLNKELVDSDEAETIDKSTAARMIDVSSTSRFFSDFMSSETPAETSDSEDEAKESNTESSDISSRESGSKRVRANNENEGISEKRRRVDSKYQGESDAPTPEIIPIPRKKYPYIHKVLDSLGIKVENVLHLFQYAVNPPSVLDIANGPVQRDEAEGVQVRDMRSPPGTGGGSGGQAHVVERMDSPQKRFSRYAKLARIDSFNHQFERIDP